jgi:hypothetical protein
MSEWFKLLPLEIKEMPESEIIEPDREPGPHDQIVLDSEISLELKKLYTLAIKLQEEAEKAQLAARYCRDPQNKQRLEEQANEYFGKANCLGMIFWVSLRDENSSLGSANEPGP